MKGQTADFPDWFGPMLVKELRQGLKARAFVFSAAVGTLHAATITDQRPASDLH